MTIGHVNDGRHGNDGGGAYFYIIWVVGKAHVRVSVTRYYFFDGRGFNEKNCIIDITNRFYGRVQR